MLDFFKQLFASPKNTNQPILRELLLRSDVEKQEYEVWKVNDRKDDLLEELKEQFRLFFEEGKSNNAFLRVLNTAKTRGFILKFDALDVSKVEFQHLFDYLREKVLLLNYTSYLSDVKSYIRKDYVEKVERHYLKPRFDWDEATGISNQLYGNVTIEQTLYDDEPIQLKFLLTPYHDYKWSKALDFELLVEEVLA